MQTQKTEPMGTMRVTRALAMLIGHNMRRAQEIGQRVLKAREEFLALPPGGRAFLAFRRVDRAVATKTAHSLSPVSCRRGCSACCRMLVEIGPSEAGAIVAYLKSEGRPLPIDALRAQAAHAGLDDTAWWRLPDEVKRCVFLEGDECSIYPARPVACRKYLVTGGTKNCGNPTPGTPVKVVPAVDAEVIASVLIDLECTGGPMAPMILAAAQQT